MDFHLPSEFTRLISGVARELRKQNLPFMLIGGQAVLVHGEPRLTQDIDITLGCSPADLPRLLDLCRNLELRPLTTDIEAFVRRTFVLPVADSATGIRIDFIFSTLPYERLAIKRAEHRILEGESVAFASAEDLILHKLFAGRPRDIEDVVGVLNRRSEDLDWPYMEKWAKDFSQVPGRENLMDRLQELRKDVGLD